MSTSSGDLEAPRSPEPTKRVRMILFVADEEANSQAARANLARICEYDLAGRADVEIIDVLVDHRKALQWRVLLTPALLIFTGSRPARVTGTLEHAEQVLTALGITEMRMKA